VTALDVATRLAKSERPADAAVWGALGYEPTEGQ
jgi:hypothetical protein